ncbi:hypothetical protein NE237_027171 [Protea cynaroides]|uniref:Uncharacterized protein n=1 Tax=Protea cynaroides TaxID=273540 RepID=A0A9Q0GN20_9MAGN|nr:hypothetical protein NE237_027171 [Protea cynaroides]
MQQRPIKLTFARFHIWIGSELISILTLKSGGKLLWVYIQISDSTDGCRAYYTLLMYLNGGDKVNSHLGCNQDSSELLVGEEIVFYDSRLGIVAEVAPVEGMALLHIHGNKLEVLMLYTKSSTLNLLYEVVLASNMELHMIYEAFVSLEKGR